MVECKYYSFYALAKINDPELLYEAFQQQIAPRHANDIEVEVYEHSDKRWNRLTRSGGLDQNIPPEILEILQQRFGTEDTGSWYYDAEIEGWFCSYKPLTSKHFVLLVKCADPEQLIEEDYLQFLFHFYCHQLQMLQGTYRDALTGLYNRRYLDERLLAEWAFATRHRAPLAVLLLDLDHFKHVNDTHGHQCGDAALRAVADCLSKSLRAEDVAARYGGEEFMILTPATDINGAHAHAERLRRDIESYPFSEIGTLSCSFGVTEFRPDQDDVASLFKRADAALYHAKEQGRNRVETG